MTEDWLIFLRPPLIEKRALQYWTLLVTDIPVVFLRLQFSSTMCVLWEVFSRYCVGGRTGENLLAGLPLGHHKGSKVLSMSSPVGNPSAVGWMGSTALGLNLHSLEDLPAQARATRPVLTGSRCCLCSLLSTLGDYKFIHERGDGSGEGGWASSGLGFNLHGKPLRQA